MRSDGSSTRGNVWRDGLDADQRYPWMWAAKPPTYYGSLFYNWPYAFGFLFGLGVVRPLATTPTDSATLTTCCRPPVWHRPTSSPLLRHRRRGPGFWESESDGCGPASTTFSSLTEQA
ncbi:MAG: hypothetical protein R2710_29310 [Acidimicrobiales bacterium]